MVETELVVSGIIIAHGNNFRTTELLKTLSLLDLNDKRGVGWRPRLSVHYLRWYLVFIVMLVNTTLSAL